MHRPSSGAATPERIQQLFAARQGAGHAGPSKRPGTGQSSPATPSNHHAFSAPVRSAGSSAPPSTAAESPRPPTSGRPHARPVSGAVTQASPPPPPELLQSVMQRMPIREVVSQVVGHLIAHQAFGSPLTILEQEYTKQLNASLNSQSALFAATQSGETADDAQPRKGMQPAHGLTRTELQEQYLLLHAAHTKQSMEIVARDERIARLMDKVTELSRSVYGLKRTVVAATSNADPQKKGLAAATKKKQQKPAVVHDDDNPSDDSDIDEAADENGVVPPQIVIERLQNLNQRLSQRIETLEQNSGIGWMFVEPELDQYLLNLQTEVDRLTGLNAQLSAAYLHLHEVQADATSRAEVAETELQLMTRRRDHAEKELLAMRVAIERNKVDNM